MKFAVKTIMGAAFLGEWFAPVQAADSKPVLWARNGPRRQETWKVKPVQVDVAQSAAAWKKS
jgi:hypothetical protein